MRARIYLTESCNASCPWCFNKNTRNLKLNMNTEKAKKLFDWYSENGIKEVFIMGGEPTIHPDFLELYNYIHQKDMVCRLYTNGREVDTLSKLRVLPQDRIVFNWDTVAPLNEKLYTHFCTYRFEVVVRKETDMDKLFSKIEEVNNFGTKLHLNLAFNITPDCTENWFENKQLLNEKLRNLFAYIQDHRYIYWRWDHSYPLCYLDVDIANTLYGFLGTGGATLCSGTDGCYGLVTSNFDLVHCNQYQQGKLPLFDTEGNIIPFHEAENFLYMEHLKKLGSLENSSCIKCKYFPNICNGACQAHKFKH